MICVLIKMNTFTCLASTIQYVPAKSSCQWPGFGCDVVDGRGAVVLDVVEHLVADGDLHRLVAYCVRRLDLGVADEVDVGALDDFAGFFAGEFVPVGTRNTRTVSLMMFSFWVLALRGQLE